MLHPVEESNYFRDLEQNHNIILVHAYIQLQIVQAVNSHCLLSGRKLRKGHFKQSL